MDSSADSETNPFATRWTRPGAFAYRFVGGVDARRLVDRLAAQRWRGQIVGPHGSGKSSLLKALLPEIEIAGRRVDRYSVASGQRWWWPGSERVAGWDSLTVVIVDGYEQLGAWSRWRLRRACRKRRAGLVVTAHADVGFDDLARTNVTLELAEQLVAELQASVPPLVTATDVRERYLPETGNFRELLFELYDLYELRRRASSG